MKISLALKIILMILVPLFAGLGYIMLLNRNLDTLDKYLSAQEKVTKILLLKDRAIVGFDQRMMLFGMYRATQDKMYMDRFVKNDEMIKSVMRTIAQLCADNPERVALLVRANEEVHYWSKGAFFSMTLPADAKISDMLGGKFGMRMTRSFLASRIKAPFTREFEKEEERVIKTEELERAQANEIAIELYSGLVVAICVYIAMIWWFKRSISSRLQTVLDNIKRTGSGDQAFQEMHGADEIDALNASVVESAKQIRQAEKEQAQTVRLIAEELELPLQSIANSYTNLRDHGFVELSKSGNERLTMAIDETDRLQALVEELSKAAEVKAVKIELNLKVFELAELGKSAVSVVQEFAKTNNVEIVCDFKPLSVSGDFDRVKQVAINLLSNAIKFSPPGGKIYVETNSDSGMGLFSVRDEGTGIPREFKDRIFRRYEQAGAGASNRSSSGTGLGLAISKELMAAQKGQLQFESPASNGKGSRFSFSLPKCDGADSAGTANASSVNTADGGKTASAGFSTTRPSRSSPLWLKGALLVSIPMIVYIVMTALLLFTLHSIRDNMDQLTRSRTIASINSDLIMSMAQGWNFAIYYNASQDPEYMRGAHEVQAKSIRLIEALEGYAATDQEIARGLQDVKTSVQENIRLENELLAKKEEVIANKWFGSASAQQQSHMLTQMQDSLLEAMEREGKKIEGNGSRLHEIHGWTEVILLSSAIMTGLVTFALATILALRWRKRVRPILENLDNLSKGESPSNLLFGDDELATIDNALHDAATKMAELKKFKNELLAVTSHELRTPLTSLAAMTEMIEAYMFGTLTESGKRDLAQAEVQNSYLIFTITNLLDLEKMLSGKTLVQKESILVSDAFNKVMTSSERAANERGIQVEYQTGPVKVLADPRRLVQLLTALVRHFIDVVPEQSALELVCEQIEESVQIVFKTPKPATDQVFDLFRLHHTAREHLVEELARTIAAQHGGSLSISEERNQRCYTLTLAAGT